MAIKSMAKKGSGAKARKIPRNNWKRQNRARKAFQDRLPMVLLIVLIHPNAV